MTLPAGSLMRWEPDGSLVGRRGLEPRTSALEGPERCADQFAKIESVERWAGCYQDAGSSRMLPGRSGRTCLLTFSKARVRALISASVRCSEKCRLIPSL